MTAAAEAANLAPQSLICDGVGGMADRRDNWMGFAQAEFQTARHGEIPTPRLPTPVAKAGPLFFSLNSYTKMRGFSNATLAQAGMLLLPMKFNDASDRFDAIEWGHCFHLIAQKLHARESSPFELGMSPGISFVFDACGDVEIIDKPPVAAASDKLKRQARHNAGSKPELVVHLVSSLRREHLVLGKDTLLLPCLEPAQGRGGSVADFLRADGCWALPSTVLCREIASRIQAFC